MIDKLNSRIGSVEERIGKLIEMRKFSRELQRGIMRLKIWNWRTVEDRMRSVCACVCVCVCVWLKKSRQSLGRSSGLVNVQGRKETFDETDWEFSRILSLQLQKVCTKIIYIHIYIYIYINPYLHIYFLVNYKTCNTEITNATRKKRQSFFKGTKVIWGGVQ